MMLKIYLFDLISFTEIKIKVNYFVGVSLVKLLLLEKIKKLKYKDY